MLARPQTEALLEIVSVVTLPGDFRRVLVEEEPSKIVGLPPMELILHEFAVLDSFPLYCLFSSLPFTGLGRNGGLFFYTMHLMFYTVPRLLTGLSRIGSGHSFRTTTPVNSGLFIMPSSGFVSWTGSLPSLFAAAST